MGELRATHLSGGPNSRATLRSPIPGAGYDWEAGSA